MWLNYPLVSIRFPHVVLANSEPWNDVESSAVGRANAAYELIDWLRLVGEPIGPEGVNCVIQFIKKCYPPAISAVAEYLDPIGQSIWSVIDIEHYTTSSIGW